ncbi:MAG: SRPBCC family protein [Crocinitomicaceae bacterium]|nr:SRPBCC family protein [Crocinitomicaceae bacterium]
MGVYQFKREQFIKVDLEELWEFISSPKNLSVITPDTMNFKIISVVPEKMYPGLMIHYKVSPLPLYRTNWLTEITHVEHLKYFVDEQRHGPYKIWHHEHFLEPLNDGVLMRDIITYQPPFGVLGTIANKLLINNQINRIFDYRKEKLNEIFG